jgi:hypothetical protein
MPRRPVHIPLYALLVLVLAAVSGPPLSVYASTRIAKKNSAELVDQYRADQAAASNANRTIYCVLFDSQIRAFEDATTETGQESYRAWLAVYKLAQCQPTRK